MTAPSLRKDAFTDLANATAAARVPTTAVFQVTDRCNYRCVHCYQEHTHKKELSTAGVIDVLDQLAELGVLFLTLMGGEFFVRADAEEIVEAAHARGFSIKVLTTGHHVDAARADRLATFQPIRIDLSVYGAHADVHDKVTDHAGSWERTIRAARLFVERGIAVNLKSPVMNVNVKDLPDLSRLAEELDVVATFDPMLTAMENGDAAPLHLRASDEQIREFFSQESGGIWSSLQRLAELGNKYQRPDDATPCGAASKVLGITPQGKIWPCNSLPIEAGDLTKTRLRDIWENSPQLRRIRNLSWSEISECNRCELRRYCSRCHAMAKLEDGKLAGPSLEACRQAVIKRDLLRDKGLIAASDVAMPPTWSRIEANQRGRRARGLRVLP